MKLYNKTKCPDEIIKPLLIAAGKSVRARTTNVIVKVTQGSGCWTRGWAKEAGWVKKFFLDTRQCRKGTNTLKTGKIKTDRGYLNITLPGNHYNRDVLMQANETYKLAQHEWAHVRDFQQRTFIDSPINRRGRIRWEERPCEIAAEEMVAEAGINNKAKGLITHLAHYYRERASAKNYPYYWNIEQNNKDGISKIGIQEYREEVAALHRKRKEQ